MTRISIAMHQVAEVVVVEVLARHPRVVRRERRRRVRGVHERHVHRLLGPPHVGRVGDEQDHHGERDREDELGADPQAAARRVVGRPRARDDPVAPDRGRASPRTEARRAERADTAGGPPPARPPRSAPRRPRAPCAVEYGAIPTDASIHTSHVTSRRPSGLANPSPAPGSRPNSEPGQRRRRQARRPRPARRSRAPRARPEATGRCIRPDRLGSRCMSTYERVADLPADDRRLRARGSVAPGVERLRPPDDDHPPARRR